MCNVGLRMQWKFIMHEGFYMHEGLYAGKMQYFDHISYEIKVILKKQLMLACADYCHEAF